MINKLWLSVWAVVVAALWYVGYINKGARDHVQSVLWSNPISLSQIWTIEDRLNFGQKGKEYWVALEWSQPDTDIFVGSKTVGEYFVSRKVLWPISTGGIKIKTEPTSISRQPNN